MDVLSGVVEPIEVEGEGEVSERGVVYAGDVFEDDAMT